MEKMKDNAQTVHRAPGGPAGEGTARVPSSGTASRPAGGPGEAPMGVLVCVSGLVKGREFPVGSAPVFFGRKEGVDIVLDDGLVSRRHAEISFEEDQFVIRDLGSRNGTKVNGRKITERTVRAGDKVSVGRSVFVLRITDEAAAGTAYDFDRVLDFFRDRPRLLAACAVLLFIAGLKYGVPYLKQLRRENRSVAVPKVFNTAMNRADEALKMENYSLAKELLFQILAAQPSDTGAQALLKKAIDEEISMQAMKDFESRRAEGKMEGAVSFLVKVPEGSVYYAKAQEELKKLRASFVGPLLQDARALMKEKQWPQAREKVLEILGKDPDNAIAIEFLDLLNAWDSGSGPEKNNKETDTPRRRKSGRVIPPAGDSGLALYQVGNLDGAIAALQNDAGDLAVRTLLLQATNVRRHWAAGTEAARRGETGTAVQEMIRALEFHERITGTREGPLGARIITALAGILDDAGDTALKNMQFGAAFDAFHRAANLDANNRRAKDGLTRLEQTAEDLYRQAYVLEKVNPQEAVGKWRQILTMVSPTNEYFGKSREKIDIYTR